MDDGAREALWRAVKILPSDYADYGGQVERWADPARTYPDCSSGCRWARPLHDSVRGGQDLDWVVCAKVDGPRAGLLTWEHQAGEGCFEAGPELGDGGEPSV